MTSFQCNSSSSLALVQHTLISNQWSQSGHSRMYSILPVVIQNHLPAIPSLRKTLGDVHRRALRGASANIEAETSAPSSPPPRYTSRDVSGSSTPRRSSIVSGSLGVGDDQAHFAGLLHQRLVAESDTGINWKYATQGISLVNMARQESNALVRESQDASAVFTRQVYLHGVSYLLQGVPSDLTQEELSSLQAATPASLRVPQPLEVRTTMETTVANVQQSEARSRSLLHRVTATIIFQTVVFFQLLLPFLKSLVGQAYHLEKEHKVVQRSASYTFAQADAFRRKSMEVSHNICQMNDGMIGQAINDATLWCIEGLTGGVQQGLSDGVIMFNTEPRNMTR